MIRIRRIVFPDQCYFITSVTHKRKPIFSDSRLAQIVVDQWKHYEKAYALKLDAYCVLFDHYHTVLNIGKTKTISQVLHTVHSYTATLVNNQLGHEKKIKIWEGNPWDVVIRDEEMYWQKIAYTLFNPWRAGEVHDPLEPYKFSNLSEWREREGDEFLIDLFSKYKRWSE